MDSFTKHTIVVVVAILFLAGVGLATVGYINRPVCHDAMYGGPTTFCRHLR